MTDKIRINYCTGPTCKPLGNWELKGKLVHYQKRYALRIELQETHCFSRCQNKESLCPCIQVNDEWIICATWRDLKSKLDGFSC